MGNVVISSCIICFTNARKYFEKIIGRLLLKHLEKVAEFSITLFFTNLTFSLLEVPLIAPVKASAAVVI